MSAFHLDDSCRPAIERWFYSTTAPLTEWFPETPLSTPLRPFAGAFCAGESYVASRGILSLGEYRRAIELESGGAAEIGVRLKSVALSRRLTLAYGIPDDRLLSKFVPLHDQLLVVTVGIQQIASQPIPYLAGWHSIEIDTSSFTSTTQDLTVRIEANGTHFPVAVDADLARVAQ